MPYLTDLACLWHVPKTGGTWARRAAQAAGVKWEMANGHHSIPAACRHIPLDGRLHAVVVREPCSWYWSVFRRLLHAKRHGQNLRRDIVGCQITSVNVDAGFRRFVFENLGSYSRILDDYTAGLPAVARLSTENLPGDLAMWLKAAGEKFDEGVLLGHPQENVTSFEEESEPDWSAGFRALIKRSEPACG